MSVQFKHAIWCMRIFITCYIWLIWSRRKYKWNLRRTTISSTHMFTLHNPQQNWELMNIRTQLCVSFLPCFCMPRASCKTCRACFHTCWACCKTCWACCKTCWACCKTCWACCKTCRECFHTCWACCKTCWACCKTCRACFHTCWACCKTCWACLKANTPTMLHVSTHVDHGELMSSFTHNMCYPWKITPTTLKKVC